VNEADGYRHESYGWSCGGHLAKRYIRRVARPKRSPLTTAGHGTYILKMNFDSSRRTRVAAIIAPPVEEDSSSIGSSWSELPPREEYIFKTNVMPYIRQTYLTRSRGRMKNVTIITWYSNPPLRRLNL